MNKSRLRHLTLGGIAVTNIGSGAYAVAVAYFLFQETGSILPAAILLVTENFIGLLLQVITGRSIQRFGPAGVCLRSDVFRLFGCLAGTVMVLRGNVVEGFLVASISIQLGKPFYMASSFVLARQLVNKDRELPSFNSWFIASKSGGYLVGILLLGFIGTKSAPELALTINCASYALNILILTALSRALNRNTPESVEVSRGWASESKAVISLLRASPGVVAKICRASTDPAIAAVALLGIPPLADRFSKAGATVSLLNGAYVLGVVVAPILLSQKIWRKPPTKSRAWKSKAVQSIALTAMIMGPGLSVAVLSLFVLGVANTISFSREYAAIQLVNRKRAGQVASAYLFISSVVLMIIVIPVAELADVSLKVVFLCGAVIATLSSAAAMVSAETQLNTSVGTQGESSPSASTEPTSTRELLRPLVEEQ